MIKNDSEKIKLPYPQMKHYVWILAGVWTIVIAGSLIWHSFHTKQETLEVAQTQARVAYEKDIIYRRWNAGHGGVYVLVTKETQPNPYLSDVPERDITTPSGKALTLMNPAYMTRQAHELEKQKLGVRGHITSLNPIRPENAPDPWETEALRAFGRGETEINSVEEIQSKKYLRLMRPLITEKGCLKCHAKQGYHEGDIRGGISVSIPIGPLLAFERKHILTFALIYGLFWIVGLSGIGLGTQRLMRTERERRRAEEGLQKAHCELERKVEERTADLSKANIFLEQEISERKREVENIRRMATVVRDSNDAITIQDFEGQITAWNRGAELMYGYSEEEALQMNMGRLTAPSKVEEQNDFTRRLMAGEMITSFETQRVTKDGPVLDVWLTVTKLMDDTGKPIGIASTERDITNRKRAEAEREKLLHDLGERVKEIGCIADISRLAENPWVSIEEFVQGAVNILPPAWQYPEICCARIMLDSKEFKTANFRKTEWSQSADIIVDRKKFGEVKICYLEEKPAVDEGPFLKEERSLINTVAEFMGHIIQHRLGEAEIRDSEEKFRMIFDNANDGILLADPESKKFHFANVTICRMLGYSQEEIKNMGVMDIHPDKDIPYVIEQFEKQSRKEIEVSWDLPIKRKDGSVFYADVNSALVEISGRHFLMGVFRDITERKLAEEKIKESEETYRNLFQNAQVGLFRTRISDGKILESNEQLAKMYGYDSREEFVAEYKTSGNYVDPETREKMLHEITNKGFVRNIQARFYRKDGSVFWVSYSAKIYSDKGWIEGVLIDITERKKAEERIEYLAYYDALTGLPNRNLFLERINQDIVEAKDSSGSLAVVITDINKFKSINDIYGSEVGDRVLKEVAERLSTAVRKGDTVAHLGNNEFGIACIGLTGADDIIMLEKIIKDISYPLKINGDEIILTFSTGISLYPHDGENAFELLKSAGLAFSIAEKQGTKIFQFYAKDMTVTASEVMLLEKQLIKAIENKEFILHYQPYWDINTKKMVGMEALVRWQSKDKGLVPPGKFIPVLEDTGMIIEVGEWILREAMRQVKEWQNNGYPVVPVSVNLSLIQFRQKDLAEMIKKIMKDSGYYPSLLTLEITESAFMQDIEFTKSVLTEMKETGCSVSIDDFGTGYSSLAYLKRFPIDNLKIDISFIREMVKDPDSASIVMAIINMAHTLNLKTIAEGIETEEQWNFLRLLRCDMGQGFYLSKPLPAEDVEKMLI